MWFVMRLVVGLAACLWLGVAVIAHAEDARGRAAVLPSVATNRLLVVIGVPDHAFDVQQARFGALTPPVYVAGADPIAAVVGNIIGHMMVSKIAQSDHSVSDQKTPALAEFFNTHAVAELIRPSLTGTLGSLSINPSIRLSEGSSSGVELRKTLTQGSAFDQAVTVEPAVSFDDDLLSLKTSYAFSVWRADAGAWSRKPSVAGQINILFDHSQSVSVGALAEAANWNAADAAELKAAFDESGRILAALLERVIWQPELSVRKAFVIATTPSLEKIRGYRQVDLGTWTVIVDDNNNYHVLKPKRVFILKQEA